MADEPVIVQSTWSYFLKDFLFSIVLVILGAVILLVPLIKQALRQSLVKVFDLVDGKYHLGLAAHLEASMALYLPVGLFVMALLIDFSVLYRHKLTWVALEKESVLKRYGFPFRRQKEIKYANIRTVEVWRGWWERILGIGDLAIAAGGSQGFDIELNGIKDPDSVASIIRNRQKSGRGGKLAGTTDRYN
jgi:uncharacterized membrane protein YdbT with pleckstrin-like domain